ncbi:MAG: tetratricopeptide repeat protein [Bacteroidia bacterium]
MSIKKLLYGFSVLLIGTALWQCSTDKNRFLNRAYHNTTAHYNGYFNAREAIKEALKSFRYSYKENYDLVLPVVLYPNEAESKSMFAVMDTSISKCATVIKRHAMPEKKTGSKEGQEWGKWIDNNWLMIGVAHFHKKEFDRANEIFKYIENTYPEDENYHWSRLWAAKTYVEAEDFNAANRILLSLQSEIDEQEASKEKNKEDKDSKGKKSGYSVRKTKQPKRSASSQFGAKEEVQHTKFSKQFILEKKLTESHLYVKSKDYKKATKSLEESIELIKNRKTKARLYFILGQIQQETGQLLAAGMSYEKVLKYTPPYEMAFYAQINQVFVSTGNNTNTLRKKLIRLSKDDKNADYLDVIYFALAELEFKENNKDKGIEYLKKSAAYSKNNEKKAKAYLRLADMFYGDKKYVPSQAYYDSTLNIIKEEHDRFREVTRINKNLKELVTHLNTIEFQDSVRHLANNFSEKDIIKKIEKMIVQKQREDEEKQKQQSAPVVMVNNPGVVVPTSGGGTTFWAFDQNLRTQGYNDFKRTWGTRVNEDNWRRSDKTSTFATIGDEEAGVDSAGTKLEYTIDYYLKNVPLTEEQKWRSDSLLINAYFGAGTVYKQGLNDYPEAIKSFNKMTELFPEAELTAAAHFNLYLIYKEQKNEDLAEKHRKAILNFFPETEYAKILSDPNYLADKSKEMQKAKKEYELLLANFNEKNYPFVIENTNQFTTQKDTLNPFFCQSIYLRATSIGYLSNKDSLSAYEQALDYVVAQCPNEKVAELSQNTLDIIRKNTTQQITQISGVNYKYDAGAQHFFIYVHQSTLGSVNPLKNALSDFSMASFSIMNLNVSSAIYSQENQLVVVKPFNSKKEAESFLTAFKADKDKLKPYNEASNKFFIISQPNYLLLYKEKDLDGYNVFYEKNYKK